MSVSEKMDQTLAEIDNILSLISDLRFKENNYKEVSILLFKLKKNVEFIEQNKNNKLMINQRIYDRNFNYKFLHNFICEYYYNNCTGKISIRNIKKWFEEGIIKHNDIIDYYEFWRKYDDSSVDEIMRIMILRKNLKREMFLRSNISHYLNYKEKILPEILKNKQKNSLNNFLLKLIKRLIKCDVNLKNYRQKAKPEITTSRNPHYDNVNHCGPAKVSV